jgi:transposase
MAKNEIKLRRQLVDENALQRHRNYSLLLQKHYREKRKKKSKRIFIYSIVIAVVTVLLLIIASYFLVKWEKERELKNEKKTNQQTELKP